MTIQEAIKILKQEDFSVYLSTCEVDSYSAAYERLVNTRKAYGMAIVALQKQIPFKPYTDKLKMGIGRCKCGAEFLDRDTNYCGNCGQKLDWDYKKGEQK